jgi:hypothetical protein
MKNLKYFIFAAVCSLFAACQDTDWDFVNNLPNLSTSPYGNNSIEEKNVITIQQLIDKYPNVFASTDQNSLIEEDIQIKGYVTGNDVGGNLYKQFCLQDATRGIIIAVNQGGISGFLPIGQEILVDLKGMYIGGYRKQPEIGAPYNGTSIGRMSKDVWASHYKVLGNIDKVDPNFVAPVEFSDIMNNKDANCAKLVKLTNVSFPEADGTTTFAPQGESNTNRSIFYNGKNHGTSVVVRTSSYADFAAMKLPKGTGTLYGIATRYNNVWQILIRQTSDIDFK